LHHGYYYRNAIEMRRRAKLPRKLANWTQLSECFRCSVPKSARVALAKVPEHLREDVLLAALYAGELVTDFSVPITLDSHIHPPLSTRGGAPWVLELFERSN
jgi:hypothetical protein